MDKDFFKNSKLEWTNRKSSSGDFVWEANLKHDVKIILIQNSTTTHWSWMTNVAGVYSYAKESYVNTVDAYANALENIIKENL